MRRWESWCAECCNRRCFASDLYFEWFHNNEGNYFELLPISVTSMIFDHITTHLMYDQQVDVRELCIRVCLITPLTDRDSSSFLIIAWCTLFFSPTFRNYGHSCLTRVCACARCFCRCWSNCITSNRSISLTSSFWMTSFLWLFLTTRQIPPIQSIDCTWSFCIPSFGKKSLFWFIVIPRRATRVL